MDMDKLFVRGQPCVGSMLLLNSRVWEDGAVMGGVQVEVSTETLGEGAAALSRGLGGR